MVLKKEDRDTIRSAELVLLSWKVMNPHDAELVDRAIRVLERVLEAPKEDGC